MTGSSALLALGATVLLWTYGVGLALAVGGLAWALSWVLGWALSCILWPTRARAVPLPACATHNRHDLLSRLGTGRRAMPSERQVSTTGHHPAPFTTLPLAEQPPTLRPPAARWLDVEAVVTASLKDVELGAARRLWLNSWTAAR